jgi:ABC-type transport system involved in multi-copper enzyme maturation permease subunit
MGRLLPDLYKIHAENIIDNINEGRMNENSKKAMIEKVNAWETPLIFEYADGYSKHFAGMSISAVLIALAVAISLAPMFAGEYSAGTSQLILSSRQGKGRLIGAKLFTAMSFAVMLALVLSLLSVTLYGMVYGFDGAFSSAQLSPLFNVMFNFSIMQILCLFTLSTLLGTAMTAALTLLLSARFKSPFGVIILVGAVLLAPLFYRISPNVIWAFNLYQLLPANIMYYDAVTGYPYEIFGLPIMPYVFMPLFALAASAAMLPFAWRGFKRHQEG